MKVDYSFSDSNFSSYGVHISKSEGLLGKPKRKKPETFEYPDENGYTVDLETVVYEARTIKLNCFIVSNNIDSLINNYENFTELLYEQSQLKALKLLIDGIEKLSFDCYVSEISDLNKGFRDGQNVGTFTITFIEPEPQ